MFEKTDIIITFCMVVAIICFVISCILGKVLIDKSYDLTMAKNSCDNYRASYSIVKDKNEELKKENNRLKEQLYDWQKYDDVKLTAYCPCVECSEQYGKQTKSGKEATEGRTIAVDPEKIKIGSEVKIGGQTYIAEDVGGGVKGLHIDIYMDNHADTENFGVQYADIKVKENAGDGQ